MEVDVTPRAELEKRIEKRLKEIAVFKIKVRESEIFECFRERALTTATRVTCFAQAVMQR
jgi:hypothetical protein